MKYALIVPTIVLLVALFTDVKTQKIPNVWVLVSIVISLVSSFYFFEFEGLKQGAIAAGFALLLTLPLVLIGALGAGDMKLMFAFGLGSTYAAVFSVIFFAFFWAAALGIVIAFKNGKGLQLLKNSVKILTTKVNQTTELQKIPFTIALMLGWITYLALGVKQGAF